MSPGQCSVDCIDGTENGDCSGGTVPITPTSAPPEDAPNEGSPTDTPVSIPSEAPSALWNLLCVFIGFFNALFGILGFVELGTELVTEY